MTRDTFVEVLVDGKPPALTNICKYVLYIFTVMFLIGFLFLGTLSILLAIACGIGAYFLGIYSQIEYEYSYTDKELDIDIIYSKQKRKHLVTLDISKMEVLAPIHSYHLDEYKNRNYRVCDYSSGNPSEMDKHYVMYYSGEKKIIFDPTPEMVEAIVYSAPRKVYRD